MRYYNKVLLLAGLTLALSAMLAHWSPAFVLLAALALLAYGEDIVLWAYTRFRPAEPVRYGVGEIFPAAYDPRRKLFHWVWSVEPNRSLISASAVLQSLHELYNKLSLRRGEYLTFFWLTGEKWIRFSAPRFDLTRVRQIEKALSDYFIITREPPFVGAGRPIGRWVYMTSIWVLAYAAFAGAAALLLLPIWLWHVYQFTRHYREPYDMFAFSHKLAEDTLSADRQILELVAPADAKTFASMQKWAVAFTHRPPGEIFKRYAKTYEGLDTGKRIVRLQQLGPLLERITHHNERPIYLYAFGVDEAHSMNMARDHLASAEFWRLKEATRALSGDLARFPIFYFARLKSSGKDVMLAYEAYSNQPVYVSLTSLPNVHGVIIGPSGMGKSWTVATWAKQLAKEVKLFFVDPHADYLAWGKLFGAQIFEVPHQLPEDFEVVERSSWYRRLLADFGYDPNMTISDLLQEMGIDRVEGKALGNGHVVFLLRSLWRDSLRQALWGALMLIYLVEKFMQERSEELDKIIIFDEARLFTRLDVRITTPYAMVQDLVQGGRKFGFAVWFVLQLETQISEDLLRTASLQLFLGGSEDYARPLAAVAYLDKEDVDYLTKPITPLVAYLSGGEPYTIGVLRLKPGNLKYHVKIPLDIRMKQRV